MVPCGIDKQETIKRKRRKRNERKREKENMVICVPGMNKMGSGWGESSGIADAGAHAGGYLKDIFEDKHGK